MPGARRFTIFAVLGLLLIAATDSDPFGDRDYQSFTWRSFARLPVVHDTLDLRAPDYSLLQAAVFFVTNRYREKYRLPALRFSPALRNLAAFHSRSMARYKFVDHVNRYQSAYRTLEKRSQRFQARAHAENVASEFLYAYRSGSLYYVVQTHGGNQYYTNRNQRIPPHTYLSFAEALVRDWMGSPGHRSNILHPELKSLGCGVRIGVGEARSQSIPLAYATQNFSFY